MRPPSLVCQYMIDTGLSLYHEAYRMGGSCGQHTSINATPAAGEDGHGRGTYGLDHTSMSQKEWAGHTEHCDEFWLAEDCTRYIDRMDVPCCSIGSYYDFMCQGSVASFVGRQHLGDTNSRGQQQLILGPWLHGRYSKGSDVGELTYPPTAAFDVKAHMVEYFKHYMCQQPRMPQPAVRYYRMGAVGESAAPGNDWLDATDWPIPAAVTPFYLSPDGSLSMMIDSVEPGASSVVADPSEPADTGGGGGFAGAADARSFETSGATGSVLTFTSDTLDEPVEWTGAVRAKLFVQVDGEDADFIARVSDVCFYT